MLTLEQLALVTLVYIELSRSYTFGTNLIQAPKRPFARIQQLEQLIEKNFIQHKNVSFYAQEMAMSRKHLNRIVQEVLGKTASELLSARVILEAKRLLLLNDKSAALVAEDLGYQDHSYFTRFFKR